MDETSDLKHHYALLGDDIVCAPDLERICGRDAGRPEAAKIVRASKDRLLRCAVCGSTVKRMFGSKKRWHFALRPDQPPCDHENETLAHRRSKMALYDALGSSLPRGWTVLVEELLPNRRRPDVLAVHESGLRVAFEVQYSDLPEAGWRQRHEDYESEGIRDIWLLGHTRRKSNRDSLRDLLVSAPGQRVIYIGDLGDGVRAKEAIFHECGGGDLGISNWVKPGDDAAGGYVDYWEEYALGTIRLLPDGSPRTPADLRFEKLQRGVERERESERRRREKEARRERDRLEKAKRKAEEAERRRRIEYEKRRGYDESWRASPARKDVLRSVGEELLAVFEVEREEDRNIYSSPGEWKSGLYLEHVHGKPPKHAIDWFGVVRSAMKYPHSPKQGGKPAREAVYGFRSLLEREGLVEFVRKDEKGYKRYWRTPPSEEERRLAEARLEEERKREEERKETEPSRRQELLERFAANRREKATEPKVRGMAKSRTSTPDIELSRDDRIVRDSARGRWLMSEEREQLIRAVGWRLANVLERDEYHDRAILAHPGEWKGLLFRMFVYGRKPGWRLDTETVISIVVQEFPHTNEEGAKRTVSAFLNSLAAKGIGLKVVRNGEFVIDDLSDFWIDGRPASSRNVPKDTSSGSQERPFL
jgi:hypothetical protein